MSFAPDDTDNDADPLMLEDVIAPVHLQELRLMRDILPALLNTFRTSTSQSIDLIRSALELGDPAALARAAHSMTGAAGSLGGQRLVSLCRDLEREARAGNAASAGAALPLIEAEYRNLCQAIEQVSADEKRL